MDEYANANRAFSKFSIGYMSLKKDLPIRPSEMGVLNIVEHHKEDLTPLALAEMMGVSKPMITAHIQALTEKGYIYKEISGGDKRSFFVRSTEKGKELAKNFEARCTEYLKKIEMKLGKAEFRVFIQMLENAQSVFDEKSDKNT